MNIYKVGAPYVYPANLSSWFGGFCFAEHGRQHCWKRILPRWAPTLFSLSYMPWNHGSLRLGLCLLVQSRTERFMQTQPPGVPCGEGRSQQVLPGGRKRSLQEDSLEGCIEDRKEGCMCYHDASQNSPVKREELVFPLCRWLRLRLIHSHNRYTSYCVLGTMPGVRDRK